MNPNTDSMGLDLIDLLSERHGYVRKLAEKAWNEQSVIDISNSEWYIMSRVYKARPAISQITKNVDISRQATHKLIKKLAEKGLVKVSSVEYNKKEKCIELTDLGVACYERNLDIKARLEKKLAEKIGEEQVKRLKEILQMDWDFER